MKDIPKLLKIAVDFGEEEAVRNLLPQLDLSDPEVEKACAGIMADAARQGRLIFVQMLHQAGISVDTSKFYGMSPLSQAARSGSAEMTRLLIELGAPVTSSGMPSQKPPLLYAAIAGNLAAGQVLLEAGADVNASEDSKGFSYHPENPAQIIEVQGKNTALAYAIVNMRLSFVDLLLKYRPDLDIRDAYGRTAMHLAAKHQLPEYIPMLVGAGLPIDVRDTEGATPLMLAAEGGLVEIIQALLEQGADPDARNNRGRTAEDIARTVKHRGVLACLECWKLRPRGITSGASAPAKTTRRL